VENLFAECHGMLLSFWKSTPLKNARWRNNVADHLSTKHERIIDDFSTNPFDLNWSSFLVPI
jgi:hypothetical protein